MNTKPTLSYFSKPVNRTDFLSLLKAALSVSEYRFARQATLAWLANYPGDLPVSLIFANSLVGEGKFAQAKSSLEKLCALDPEYAEAFELLDEAQRSLEVLDPSINRKGVRSGLRRGGHHSQGMPEWKMNYLASQKALTEFQFDDAERLIQKSILSNPTSPVPAIQQVKVAHSKQDYSTSQNLAELYHRRWPECLQFNLMLAESYLRTNDDSHAVSLLHHCVSLDLTGQVVQRLWGTDHPYKALWPEQMEINFEIPIPANVSMVMGWNQLYQGAPKENDDQQISSPQPTYISSATELFSTLKQDVSYAPPVPELAKKQNTAAGSVAARIEGAGRKPAPSEISAAELEHAKYRKEIDLIKSAFQKIAKKAKQPHLGEVDGRFPVYIILSTRKGLENQYGVQTAGVIDNNLKNLASFIRELPGWGSILLYPDDAESTTTLGLKPIDAIDPWKIKLSLADLDQSLSKKGQRIGALLIVGGPEVVPFHRLPNPTDDMDPEVLSDNPYATSDENYFVLEWPIGRLPGESGTDAGMLLEGIRRLNTDYTNKARFNKKKNFITKFFANIQKVIANLIKFIKQGKIHSSFGYSARVWQDASAEVFRIIGQPKSLLTSPPCSSDRGWDISKLQSRQAYFNLHGIQDGAEWYGQKCTDDPANVPDYPVALCPQDLKGIKSSPEIVFSEACYGAFLQEQKADQSIALKFLSSGTKAFVGSTCVSYGSVTKPLIAADLIGQSFLDLIRQGQSAGNALLEAKLNLANEMSKRQGYLDGEDQKSLLSFILYGDPLAVLEDQGVAPKNILRSNVHPSLKTVTDRRDEVMTADQLPPIMMVHVKDLVSHYLPGLQDAEMALALQSCTCHDMKTQCNGCQLRAKGPSYKNQKRLVLTLSKSVKGYKEVHHFYARMTLDPNGKVVKFSTSR